MLGRFSNGLFLYPKDLQPNARDAQIIHFSGAVVPGTIWTNIPPGSITMTSGAGRPGQAIPSLTAIRTLLR